MKIPTTILPLLLAPAATLTLAAPTTSSTASTSANQIMIQRARLTENTVNQYFITTDPIPLSGETQCPQTLGLVNTTPAADKPGVHVPANIDYPYYLAFYSGGLGLYSVKMNANDWITEDVPTGKLLNSAGTEVGTCRADKSGAVTGSCRDGQGEKWEAVVWIACDVTAS